MKATIKWNEKTKVVDFDGTENDLWKRVGEILLSIRVPNTLSVVCDDERALLTISKRGTFIKDGEVFPSMYVTEEYNEIVLPVNEYEEAYLKCVNPEGNNYKFYHLIPISYGSSNIKIDAEYGSIDTDTCPPKRLREPYPSYMYWIRYYEKLSKGYKDYTKIQLHSKTLSDCHCEQNDAQPVEDMSDNAVLYRELMAYAKHVVKTSLLDPENITIAQVKEARKEFNKLCNMKTYKGFSNHLVNLFAVSPRNIGNRFRDAHLNILMPEDFSYLEGEERKESEKAEMTRIIDREETLLLAMEAVAGLNTEQKLVKLQTSFLQYQIEVKIASSTDKEFVLSQLEPKQRNLVDTVYKVVPSAQQKRFNKYVKDNKIKEIKHLWHGSVNANWASIVSNSLQMRPAANGRMFGDGHYFAPSSDKSWGYTSFAGSYWASGNDNVAFMGLYKVAYGNPWLVTRSGYQYCQELLHNKGYDCVHAMARNTGLRRDEIIVYSNDALCLEYLVKFKG